MVDFIFVVIELFSPSLTVETLSAEIGRSRRFSKGGWITLSAAFRGKGTPPTNQCWYQKTRDCRFVWYQNICSPSFSFVTIHASDGRTDRWTDRQTDRQNCDSNTVRCITCSRTVLKIMCNVQIAAPLRSAVEISHL